MKKLMIALSIASSMSALADNCLVYVAPEARIPGMQMVLNMQ